MWVLVAYGEQLLERGSALANALFALLRPITGSKANSARTARNGGNLSLIVVDAPSTETATSRGISRTFGLRRLCLGLLFTLAFVLAMSGGQRAHALVACPDTGPLAIPNISIDPAGPTCVAQTGGLVSDGILIADFGLTFLVSPGSNVTIVSTAVSSGGCISVGTFTVVPPSGMTANFSCRIVVTFTQLNGDTGVLSGTWTVGANQNLASLIGWSVFGGPYGRNPTADRQSTQRAIQAFLTRRADQILTQQPSLADRLGSGRGSTLPGCTPTSDAPGARHIGCSVSLHGMRVSAIDKGPGNARVALGAQSAMTSGMPSARHFDIWLQGSYSHIDHDTVASKFGLMFFGLDYRLSPKLLIGAMLQMDWVNEKDATNNTAARGRGWLVGPYIVMRVRQNLILDARIAWGGSDNFINALGLFSDAFKTNRWTADANLTGKFISGNWRLTPTIGVQYFREIQGAYSDSLGNIIASQTISLGRLTFGPRIGYLIGYANGSTIEPYVSIKGIWDFERSGTTSPHGILASTSDIRARIEGGAKGTWVDGWSIRTSVFYDGIGASNFEAYGGRIRASVPLN